MCHNYAQGFRLLPINYEHADPRAFFITINYLLCLLIAQISQSASPTSIVFLFL